MPALVKAKKERPGWSLRVGDNREDRRIFFEPNPHPIQGEYRYE
jgi:hypothetical protein